MDGVLIETERVWARVEQEVVLEYGGTWHDDAHVGMLGMKPEHYRSYIRETLGAQIEDEALRDEIQSRLLAVYREAVPFIEGAVDSVRAVSVHWPVAIASSSDRVLIETVVRSAGLTDVFGTTVSSEDVARGKPAPDIYLEAARRLEVLPERAVAIEDSGAGIMAAHAAGMRVIAVPSESYPPRDEQLALAAWVVDSVADVTPGLVRDLVADVVG